MTAKYRANVVKSMYNTLTSLTEDILIQVTCMGHRLSLYMANRRGRGLRTRVDGKKPRFTLLFFINAIHILFYC